MAHVRDILRRPPPGRLYHYTTQAGLLGIASQREIWASHTQYLNDTREFQHGISVLREELARLKHPQHQQVRELEQSLDGIESINVCVCSFSADGDVLSQWRAYGGAPSGFSIGFSGSFL